MNSSPFVLFVEAIQRRIRDILLSILMNCRLAFQLFALTQRSRRLYVCIKLKRGDAENAEVTRRTVEKEK